MVTGTGRIGVRLWVSIALLLPVLSGCAAATASPAAPPAPAATSAPTPAPSASPGTPVAVPEVPTSDASIGNVVTASAIAPVRLRVNDLDIDMNVEAMGVDADGQMALPENASEAGWYRYGPGVASEAGATVVAAHIDSRHDGIGPFSRLRDAPVGGTVSMTGADGVDRDYVITEVRSVGKIDAPMAELFDRSGAPRLVLVTCGGAFDSGTGHYVDNIIVTATPVGPPASGG